MIITCASFKGGVGKTTSAVHFATFLQAFAPTMLVDGDPNRSASNWARHGKLPFAVIDERQATRHARAYEHIVIDTKARPDEEDLKALADGCDLLIIPTTPDALALDALMLTVKALRALGTERYRILITMVPPKPSRDGDDARQMLQEAGLPLFAQTIRRLVAFQKAALHGLPVQQVADPRAAEAWSDYEHAGREIMA
ncbi:MAG: ParA family protein [Candidatus Viridilinea halotolerans]|uniref:ParA family protein n=1 Tax=Candidatus Viridilinea halotolerans TaxID=2491704 RepID=A0A426TQE2_9CHLR|nr:MAG: ParA family protein [Candidatus Viridilinea halotolerans]